VRGRGISEEESRTGAAVAVVTEATARRLWPNQEPVGKNVLVDLPTSSGWSLTSHRVIGVAHEAVGLMVPSGESEPLFMYAPLPPLQAFTLLVKTSGEAKDMPA